MKKIFGIVVICFLIVALGLALKQSIATFGTTNIVTNDSEKDENKKIVVIDPGHGGFDPGKVGVNDVLEKDINLSISQKLKEKLEAEGIEVLMTRSEDCGLYSSTDSNKKRTDMQKRVEIINTSNATIAVSIHQNSFSQESSKGAQVFYHESSEKGKVLGETLQEVIKSEIADGNHRVAKSNDSYYMLRKTQCPLVIVECGFLSNYEEAKLLTEDEYQDKMATAILNGIKKYLEQNA